MMAFKTICAAVLLGVVLAAPAAAQTLQWDPNQEPPTLSGYQVLIGTVSGQYGAPIPVGKVTSFAIPAATTPTYLAVQAVGTDGQISPRSAEVVFTPAVTPAPPPPPTPVPCAIAIPQITVTSWDSHLKLSQAGTIAFDLAWTAEIGDRTIAWVETQLGSQPASRVTNADVLATLTLLKYRSTAKGLFNLVVRAGDSSGCIGSTGALRQVRVN